MSGQDEGGGGFKKKDHNLESDFTLDAGQEDVVCVDLDGEWSEQSKIFSHPSYKNPDIQFVSGEVGEGGDHMNLTFKNVSQHSVTITGDTIVVFVSEDPDEIDPNIKEGATNDQIEKEKEKAKIEEEAKEAEERERIAKEKAESERIAKEKAAEEAKRLEAERLEKQRQEEEAKRLEAARLEKQRQEEEAKRLEAEKEQQRQEEAKRLEAERLEQQRQEEAKRLEAERLERQRQEEEARRLEAEMVEKQRQEEEAKRLEAEKLEKLRQEEVQRLEAEKEQQRQAEAKRLEAEKLEQQRQEEVKRLEAVKLEQQRQEEAKRLEEEKLKQQRQEEVNRLEAEKVEEAKRLENEKIEAEKAAAKRISKEKGAEEKTPMEVDNKDEEKEKINVKSEVDAQETKPIVVREKCTSDPNFAVICSFLDQFGATLGVPCPSIMDLQTMLESDGETAADLITFMVRMLRKLKKSVSMEKWEKALVKFAFTCSSEDGWELDRFGYKQAKLALKIRLIKYLCETQFDLNAKFKLEINKIESKTLRLSPVGKDKLGNAYWFQVDPEANLRVYREDLDEETWELVADTRDQLDGLVSSLTDKEAYTRTMSQDEDPEEDSMQGYDDIIRDTGPVESSNANSADVSRYNSEDEDTRSSFTTGRDTPERAIKNRAAAHKIFPLKKRGLSESPVDFDRADSDLKRARLDEVGEEMVEKGSVAGRGSGADNNAGNVIVGEEQTDVFTIVGRGLGAECEARNVRAANGVAVRNGRRNASEDDSEEEEEDDDEDDDVPPPVARKSKAAGVKGAKGGRAAGGRGRGRGRSKAKSDSDEDEESEEDNSEEEEEEDRPLRKAAVARKSKNDESEEDSEDSDEGEKPKNGKKSRPSESEEEKEEEEKKPAPAAKGRGRGRGKPTAEEPPRRAGSSRVQILKQKEEERKKKEEETRLRMYEEQKRKKEEREKRKMEKMKALGTEYMIAERKRKLKKKLRKRKRALKDADEEDEDYEEKKARRKVLQEKKILKIKKKKAAWENVNKEFCKFSSGSDGEGLEDEEELEELYHEIEDRELLFKSDHEFR